MSTNATHEAPTRETTIEADPNLPTIRIIRDFDAPPDRVFRAWTDPALVVQWLGPKSTEIGSTSGTLAPEATIGMHRCRTAKRWPPSTGPSMRCDRASGWCKPSPGKACPTASLGNHDIRRPW